MQIEITQQDIDRGEQHNTRGCAIARALMNAFGTSDVYVHPRHGIKVGPFNFAATKEIFDFILAFDQHRSNVRPTALTLSPIQHADLHPMQYAHSTNESAHVNGPWHSMHYNMQPAYMMDMGKPPMPMMMTMSAKEAKHIYGSYGSA